MDTPIPDDLIEALRTTRHVAILTGAGVSAESGIPTFRNAQTGLWAQYSAQELATPEAFHRNPRLVWEWYASRRERVTTAQPNPGHYALAEMEARVPRFTLITQNVDGLHLRAGNSDPIELHGNLMRARCSVEGTVFTSWAAHETVPPPCPACGALLRPDIVWFGEALPSEALERAWAAAKSCDLFLSIGTSGVVEPAASLPRVAYNRGATLVLINLDVATSVGPRSYYLNARSGVVLPALVSAAFPQPASA